jgi:glycosyltransferase involved in cell wall biosynthesis
VADRALHIGIDAREIVGRPTGVGRWVSELARAWATEQAAPHRFTFFLPHAATLPESPRFSSVVLPTGVAGTVWEQLRLPAAANAAGLDVFFAPAYTMPLSLRCPAAVLIHDVSYFAHPEWFGRREGLRRRWLTRQATRRAGAVLTVSGFSADEIARYTGADRSRIVVVPPGAPPADAGADIAREPLVLYVGSLFTRRRIPDLISGFALTRARVPGARLVLVGDNRTQPPIDPVALARAAGVGEAVEWRTYVDDAALARLYRQARAFALLSDYEGYLMTPLEAFAHGVPAVLLDTPIAREAYGGAATLVAPGPGALADALVPLLSDDKAHAAAVEAGRARLARASWTATAAKVLETLTGLAATR